MTEQKRNGIEMVRERHSAGTLALSNDGPTIVGHKLFIDKYCIICTSLYSQMYGYVVSTVPGPSAEEVVQGECFSISL